jgi:hypothetical protein
MAILINDFIARLAKQLNKPFTEVEEIYRSQWKFLRQEIESAQFNNIKIMYLGKFAVKGGKKEYWSKRLQEDKLKNEQLDSEVK